MRTGIGMVLGLVAVAAAVAAEPEKGGTRYGIAADPKEYPQGTAKEALASVLEAAEAGKFDYLVAQLADPAWVDDRVKRVYGGRFEQQVEDTRARLDPSTRKLLRRFLKDGEWSGDEEHQAARLADVKDRVVSFKKADGRWFLVHASKPKG